MDLTATMSTCLALSE